MPESQWPRVPFHRLLVALARAKVRFLVAGGVAMNLHGLERTTADLDLIIFLEKGNTLKFGHVMTRLGYIPRVPVKVQDFADADLRRRWIEEKNMVVFSFRHRQNDLEVVDVFVDHPRPFDLMWKNSKRLRLLGYPLRIVGMKDMLFLKRKANRPKDQIDIRFLESVFRKREED